MGLQVKAFGDVIAVGDLMKSVHLLKYNSEAKKLEELARDFNQNCMRAVEFFNGTQYILGAEDNCNIFVVKRQSEGVSEEESRRLCLVFEYHLGDAVNVIRPGVLSCQPYDANDRTNQRILGHSDCPTASSSQEMADNSARVSTDRTIDMCPSLLLGTVDGSIITVLSLCDEAYAFYSALEVAMRSVVNGVGGLSQSDYRCSSTGRRLASSGINAAAIDGDFVESFLRLSASQKIAVVRSLNDSLTLQRSRADAPMAATVFEFAAVNSRATGILLVEDVEQRVEEIARFH